MTARFTGKIALVTGGAAGIGAATARLLLAEGAQVAIVDIDRAAGEAVAAALGTNASFYRCDVSDDGAVASLVATVAERYGGLDLLFNNAGIGTFGKTPDVAVADWQRVIAVNLNSVFFACRAVIPHMCRRGGGAIVNTASISGLAGDYGFTAYNASKAAVINYTRALAIDHAADNIRVNALCPGLVGETNLTAGIDQTPGGLQTWTRNIPMGRAGRADEMAQALAFLASDQASYITGSILVADGGLTAHTGQPNLIRLVTEQA